MFTRTRTLVASAAFFVTLGTPLAAGAWHIDVQATTDCLEGKVTDIVEVTNPAESWNPVTAEFRPTFTSGLDLPDAIATGETVTAPRDIAGNPTDTATYRVEGNWHDKASGEIIDVPASAEVTVQHKGDCVPPETVITMDVSVTCTQVGGPFGTSEFKLHASYESSVPLSNVSFTPGNEETLPSGESVLVTMTYTDSFGRQVTLTKETEPVANCTTTPPPPDTTPTTTPQPESSSRGPVNNTDQACPKADEERGGVNEDGDRVCLGATGNGEWSGRLPWFGAGASLVGGIIVGKSRKRKEVMA